MRNPRGIRNRQAKTEQGGGGERANFFFAPHFVSRRTGTGFLYAYKRGEKNVFISRCYTILMVTCEQGTCIFLLYRPGRTSDRSDQVVAAPCLCASLGNAESCPPEIEKILQQCVCSMKQVVSRHLYLL